MCLNQFKLTLVIAALHTTHIAIEESLLRTFDDTLRTRKHRRQVVQEWYPQVDVTPIGFLVSYISNNQWFALALIFHDMSQRLFHRDADTAKALANIQEQFVKFRILNGMIQLRTDALVRHG